MVVTGSSNKTMTRNTLHVMLEDCLPGRVLPWPSYSPYMMNPIKNVWAVLKKKVERKVKYMVIKNKNLQEEFLDIVRQEWHDLDNNVLPRCINTCKSMY